jgi:CRISPR-associated endonuclease/helicase Cas3
LTTHVIGFREPPGDIRTFKVERLRSVKLGLSDFVMPDDFDPTALLNDAWGIWYTSEPPVEVVLKFASRVRRRVMETRWHRNQADPEVLEDGSVIWRCWIAEPREMLPWVRGWGADVEVLAPAEMRAEVRRNVREMAKVYQVAQQKEMPRHWRLWAKADKRTGELHRLVYHMTDVGMVAHALWEGVLGADLKTRIATWLKTDEPDAGKLIAFWSSLHDLGKASPAFQDHQNVTQVLQAKIHAELGKAGLAVKKRGKVNHARHEVISTWSLDKEEWLVSCTKLNDELAKLVAQMLGGHHGAWPDSTLFLPDHLKTDDKGDEAWRDVRKALVMAMADTFQPPSLRNFEPNTTEDNVMLSLISGIVSLADWLGSDEENFAYEEDFVELGEYANRARKLAEQALTRAEWESAPLAAAFDFQTAFSFSPNEAQNGIMNSLQNAVLPSLAIIEAPMGSGKTEAALAIYAAWAQKLGQARLYVAMPTTATSNQMWERVNDFVGKQYGVNAQPMLVHSQALLRQTDRIPESENSLEEIDKTQNGDRVASQTWFLPRKRSLLVPFGVGTVDQALMSVLQTKHFFVRLLGLAGKVVIFDEVHAYDAYMNTLFCRLLQWLRQVGASVIVLSATLPQKARKQLLAAWGATEVPDAQYPRLTWANSDSVHAQVVELPSPPKRTLAYGWIGRDTDAIIQKLKDELRQGGCAAVICNTVSRAQQIYEAINSDAFLQTIEADNRILFHARFPLAWREDIETRVLAKFGPNTKDKKLPNPNRPKTAIVVATQVIEQSLDLDFDVMLSDHAPADLLLQRAGRLHRHSANTEMRQHADMLWIAEPQVNDGIPTFARGDVYVYDEYVLLRSWLALKQCSGQRIVLPENVSALIEQVYGEQSLGELPAEIVARLARTKQEMEKEERNNIHSAKTRLIDTPHDEDLLWGNNEELEEDNPAVHQAFQALTRGDRPGTQVICLHRVGDVLMTEPDGSGYTYDPRVKVDKTMAQELARHSIAIRRPDLEEVLLEPSGPEAQRVLKAWRKNPILRYQRVAIFVDSSCLVDDGFTLRLTREYGLQIYKNA